MAKRLEAYLSKYNYSRELLDVIHAAEHNSPFYMLNNEEAIDVIKNCCFTDPASLKLFINYINDYCQQYEDTELHININKRFVVPTSTYKYLLCETREDARRLITRREMLDFVSELPQASYKFVALGLYEGIGTSSSLMEDLTMTMADGIKLAKNEITLYSGKTYTYSRELILIAVQASEETEYYDFHGRKYKTVDNGKIVRPKESSIASPTPQSAYKRIMVWFNTYRKLHPEYDKFRLPEINGSGFINSIEERLGGERYRASDRYKIKDILEKYSRSEMADSSINNMINKYRRVI